jgi:hypothetical protein
MHENCVTHVIIDIAGRLDLVHMRLTTPHAKEIDRYIIRGSGGLSLFEISVRGQISCVPIV